MCLGRTSTTNWSAAFSAPRMIDKSHAAYTSLRGLAGGVAQGEVVLLAGPAGPALCTAA
jgi:hypothetical protein